MSDSSLLLTHGFPGIEGIDDNTSCCFIMFIKGLLSKLLKVLISKLLLNISAWMSFNMSPKIDLRIGKVLLMLTTALLRKKETFGVCLYMVIANTVTRSLIINMIWKVLLL